MIYDDDYDDDNDDKDADNHTEKWHWNVDTHTSFLTWSSINEINGDITIALLLANNGGNW